MPFRLGSQYLATLMFAIGVGRAAMGQMPNPYGEENSRSGTRRSCEKQLDDDSGERGPFGQPCLLREGE